MIHQNEIDFISAHEGGIQMYANDGLVGYAKTANSIAYVLKSKGVASSAFHSSSMDFADEYGFENYDGAWNLFEAAMELV
jgi:hypothetical protein